MPLAVLALANMLVPPYALDMMLAAFVGLKVVEFPLLLFLVVRFALLLCIGFIREGVGLQEGFCGSGNEGVVGDG